MFKNFINSIMHISNTITTYPTNVFVVFGLLFVILISLREYLELITNVSPTDKFIDRKYINWYKNQGKGSYLYRSKITFPEIKNERYNFINELKKSGITETDLKNYISDFKARDSRLDSINKIIIALILVPIAAAIIQSNSEIISLIIAITFFISFLTILFFMAYTLINLDQIQLNKQRISIFKEVLTYFDDNYDDKYIEKEASSNWQFVGINIAILVVIGGALIAFGHYYLNLISDHKEYAWC